MKKIPFIQKRDMLIIAFIFILGIMGLIIPKIFNGNAFAEISFSGAVSKQVDLSNDTAFWINDIEFEVKDRAIRVVHSPCHDKICVHTGFISSPAQVIVCVPKKLVVKIISDKNDADLIVG